jgi:glycosyltransferase involved in cell wall biosynthesis
VVITSDRRYAERAAARVARARGVPSVLFSGTLVLPRDRTNAFDIGDRVLVIGEHLRRALMEEEGIPARRITVIGDPRSNAARLVSHPKLRADVYRDFDLAPGRPLLVLVSKYVSLLFSSQEKEGLYRTVFEGVRRLGDSHVVVKVHPNEDLGRLREQVAEWGWAGAILTKDYDIHRLFRAAAAAIMVTSMAGIEAMALGCPVVAVQTAGKDFEGEYMPPYVSANAVARVDMGDPAALATTLRTLQDDPAARAALVERGWQFAARYVHPVDGALAQRLWRTVGEIRAEIEARPR